MENSYDSYQTRKNVLTIGNDEIPFNYQINEVLEVFNMVIVRLESPKDTVFNENVFGVSRTEKKIIWQVPNLDYRSEINCPFVGMKFINNQLYLNNWCDIYNN